MSPSIAASGAINVSTASAVSYAAAAAQTSSSAKYVPIHRRARSSSDATSHRSASPTPSDCTLVSSTSPSTSKYLQSLTHSLFLTMGLLVLEPRVYSIATLLELSHDPEIKLISLEQKERVKKVLPEIVMNRKMRKALEYHAIQERVRAKVQAQSNPTDKPVTLTQQQQRQRPWQRRQGRSGAERKRNAGKVVDEVSWRNLRLPSVAAV